MPPSILISIYQRHRPYYNIEGQASNVLSISRTGQYNICINKAMIGWRDSLNDGRNALPFYLSHLSSNPATKEFARHVTGVDKIDMGQELELILSSVEPSGFEILYLY